MEVSPQNQQDSFPHGLDLKTIPELSLLVDELEGRFAKCAYKQMMIKHKGFCWHRRCSGSTDASAFQASFFLKYFLNIVLIDSTCFIIRLDTLTSQASSFFN